MHIAKRNLPASAIFVIAAAACTIYSVSGSLNNTRACDDSVLNIVVTTTILADLTSEIAGENAAVTGLMGAGVDPHMYQASAGDVVTMQEADIIVYNGLNLEGKMGEIFESLTLLGKTVICAGNGVLAQSLIKDADSGQYDPHIWFDVSLWRDAAREIARGLCRADAEGAAKYTENLYTYTRKLDELEGYISERVGELDASQRVLITAHDAFKYFGKAYGFEVIGLQGINTNAEAGTADMRSLADLITEREVGAVFIETSVSAKSVQALLAAVNARGHDISPGGTLYSDSLGDDSSGCGTYIEAFRSNVDTIVDSLKQVSCGK